MVFQVLNVQQYEQSIRSNRTMQKLLDAVHHELQDESAWREDAVLRALVQRAGSKEAAEILQTIQMNLVKQGRTVHMAAVQKMHEHVDEERQNTDALATTLEEIVEKAS